MPPRARSSSRGPSRCRRRDGRRSTTRPRPAVRRSSRSYTSAAAELGDRFSRNARRPSRKSSLRDDSSMANASLRRCSSSGVVAPMCSSHFASPRPTVALFASVVDELIAAASSSATGTARWIICHSRGLGAVDDATEEDHLAGVHVADATRQQPRGAAVGGEPAIDERRPEPGVVAATVKSAAEREVEADARGPSLHRAHHRDLHRAEERDQPVRLRRAGGAGCCRRAACPLLARCGPRCRTRSRSARPRR